MPIFNAAFKTILGSILGIIVVWSVGLIHIYVVDIVMATRFWLYVLLVFGYPLIFTVLYWAYMAAAVPIGIGMSEEATPKLRVLALGFVPVGFGFAFLFWQAQNWVVYGFLDVDPRFYNWVFSRMGLAI